MTARIQFFVLLGAVLSAACQRHPVPKLVGEMWPEPGLTEVEVKLAVTPMKTDGKCLLHLEDLDAGPDEIVSAYFRIHGKSRSGTARRIHGDREEFETHAEVSIDYCKRVRRWI